MCVCVCVCVPLFYLHGSPLGKSDQKVLPLPVLLHHMGKDDMPIAAGPSQLSAIRRPGQSEHTACVWLLQRIGPLEGRGEGREKEERGREINVVNDYRYVSTILYNYLEGQLWN